MIEIERMMKLLAEVTGWSDQCLSVKMGYKRRTKWLAQDESTLVDGDWGFVVSTKAVSDVEASAEGKTLEEALRNLAASVVKNLEDRARRYEEHATAARKKVSESI